MLVVSFEGASPANHARRLLKVLPQPIMLVVSFEGASPANHAHRLFKIYSQSLGHKAKPQWPVCSAKLAARTGVISVTDCM